jgi:pSer/pThr/pTyr-binding forkhead associated (FHA) protein
MADSPLQPHRSTPAELRDRLAAESEGIAFLVLRDGEGRQRIRPLAPGTDRLTIGRGAGSDLRLAWDAQVSRLHAELLRAGDEWTVDDDGLSANGTFVNGERLRGRRRLADGDVVRIGATAIAFRAPAGADLEESTVRVPEAEPPKVSEAQRRVLVALARPYRDGGAFAVPATNQAIAAELYLTVDAVKAHLRALFDRFGIADVPQNVKRVRLVELAFHHGVVGERDFEA